MATRALKQLQNAIIRSYDIDSGQQVIVGQTCVFGSLDTSVQDAGANSDLAIGVVLPHPSANATTGVLTAAALGTAGDQVQVALFCHAIVPMRVGTGGSTRGKKQWAVATGVTDAAANGGGTTSVCIVGIALQTGVATDIIGVGLQSGNRVSV